VIHIVGAGLAGSEAAWQVASRGVRVTLHEMRPVRPTAVHKTDKFAELVCSNSFRGDKLDNAVGLLKEEMRRLGSLVMRAADESRVPAGAALAVDRERFSQLVTEALSTHPLVSVVRGEVSRIPGEDGSGPIIVATGPLTSDALSGDIAAFVGAEHLYFYDAISPIVLAETIDRAKVFRGSRWGRHSPSAPAPSASAPACAPALATASALAASEPDDSGAPDFTASRKERAQGTPACSVDDGEGDYLNCPLDREDYERFYEALIHAESATVHDFDKERFFEGCLPIEVMAARGKDTLRFGPMKPVGLDDPRTGRRAYAIVQLRQDNLAGDHFSLVGFQTQLKWAEQARVLRMIPGLEQAEFVRFGMVHRNTYINGPTVLQETWQTRRRSELLFAGQVSGVEGYVESAASGLIAGINAARLVLGEAPIAPPRTTAIGALGYYVSHADPSNYQPTNIAFGIIPPLPPQRAEERASGTPLERPPRGRSQRKTMMSERALRDLDGWMNDTGVRLATAVAR
jgi:methylenetetrahydrofolate--tRNA-(uracil-5-)-methyltransferase